MKLNLVEQTLDEFVKEWVASEAAWRGIPQEKLWDHMRLLAAEEDNKAMARIREQVREEQLFTFSAPEQHGVLLN